MILKTTLREIRKSIGRYLAIVAIVALGVGFFAGLRTSRQAMMVTGENYLTQAHFYDFRLLSTLGFNQAGIDAISEDDMVTGAEGGYHQDMILEGGNTVKVLSLPDTINRPVLQQGKMPQEPDECLLDAHYKDAASWIGKTITFSSDNDPSHLENFAGSTFTVTGTCQSPLYISAERGTTSIGTGSLSGFLYLLPEAFAMDGFTEIYVTTDAKGAIHSDEYEASIEAQTPQMESLAGTAADLRYEEMEAAIQDAMAAYEAEVQAAYEAQIAAYGPQAAYEMQASDGLAAAPELTLPDRPTAYVLDRNTNTGYLTFDGDTQIVADIANVFPVFFILVAALVVMTTMTRLVDENRTQIGVLKALGYSNGRVLFLYLFYAGTATFLGTLLGFFAGSLIFPYMITRAYTIIYAFLDTLTFAFEWDIGIYCLLVALACSMGATAFTCMGDARVVPAKLIRPPAPKKGKRLLIERTFLWRKASFLTKVSLRNVFRYKKRFFMMILGVSGCTALLVAGFGIRDSIGNIVDYQYDEIFLYDYSIAFKDGTSLQTPAEQEAFADAAGLEIGNLLFLHQTTVDFLADGNTKTLHLIVAEEPGFDRFLDLHNGSTPVSYPPDGKIAISMRYANDYDIHVGDLVTLRTDDGTKVELPVSGIFDNYVFSYGCVTPATWEDVTGTTSKQNQALVLAPDVSREDLYREAATIQSLDEVSRVELNQALRERIDSMMGSLNAIVVLVVFCAGMLAFVVLYNLTNINITERIREIATIKVLGFYPGETSAYVFRENLVLTLLSAGIGLLLGKYFHAYIIRSIRIDMVTFETLVLPASYLGSFLLTFVFTFLVMFVMYFKIRRISMTESLKSVE